MSVFRKLFGENRREISGAHCIFYSIHISLLQQTTAVSVTRNYYEIPGWNQSYAGENIQGKVRKCHLIFIFCYITHDIWLFN